jgi:hypothetical protein
MMALVHLFSSLLSNKLALTKYQSIKSANVVDRRSLIDLLSQFISTFNPHPQVVHHIAAKFNQLVTLYADYLCQSNEDAIIGIKPIQTAILTLSHPSDEDLYSHPVCGSLHKEFARLCIKAKCFQHSLKIIDFPVTSFTKHTQPIDVVCYLYYKGLIYIGLHRNEDALQQFELVLSFPAQITHRVHSEAYKKAILLNLIQVSEGKLPAALVHKAISHIVPATASHQLKYKLETTSLSYS